MSFLRALVVLASALVLQAGVGHLWPASHRFIDVLLVPVALYGLNGSQRSAMLMGCASGLLRDTWFQTGAFGLNGFNRTLLGWAMGSLAKRVDMNRGPGRLAAGVVVSIGDDLLDLVLRRLLDQPVQFPYLWELLVKAGVTGLLVMLAGAIVDRVTNRRPGRRIV